VIKLVYAALADPARRPAAISALSGLLPKLKPEDWVVKVWASSWFTQMGALDQAFAAAEQVRVQFEAQGPTNAWSWLWSRELRPFRQDPRFQPFVTRLGLMAFWQKYGPPDDCDLKDGKVNCH